VNLEKLGTFIRCKREEVGIPLAKAAQKAGIGRSTLWILESGKNPKTGKPSRPSKDILERLAEVLHMNQDELAQALALADYKVDKQPQQISRPSSTTIDLGEYIQKYAETTDRELPALHSLATDYQASEEVINEALLLAESLILSLDSKGLFVNRQRVRLPGLTPDPYRYLTEQGLQASVENIENVKVMEPPIEIARSMNLPNGALVVRRFRKYIVSNVPYRISEAYFPQKFVPETTLKDMEEPSFDALPDVQKQMGEVVITDGYDEIIARLPTRDEQKQLKIIRNNPVFDIKRMSYAVDKKVVMYNHIVLNANLFYLAYNYPVNSIA
jgi:DNA-binding GntR family transcriptional regulator